MPRVAAWSPDGKSVFYCHVSGPIFLKDLESGVEKQIYPKGGVFALSPDGRWLAVSSHDPVAKTDALLLVPVEGGTPRELLRLPEPGVFNFGMAWSADGRHVLFVRPRSNFSKGELWRVAVDSGESSPVGLVMDGLSDVRVHPDGRRIAFVGGPLKSEVWVMENFLPGLRAGR